MNERDRSAEPAHVDLKQPENVDDPYPAYAWLRDNEPAHWSPGLRAWVVTRYADVLEIFNQPIRFSSERFRKVDAKFVSQRAAVRDVGRVLGEWLVFRDPPDHTRLRGLLQKSFTPRQLDRNRAGIQITIDGLLDRMQARMESEGEVDFIRDFAFPLPALVIAILLGAPKQDIEPIKRWSDQLAAYLGGSIEPVDNFSEAREGLDALVGYFRDLLRAKKRSPSHDLMSLMLAAEDEGDALSEDEVISNCVLLLFAGHETTTNLLGNGLFHLLRHPEQLKALRTEPALVPGAVEECLRYEPPVPATTKVATEDVEWHGRTVRSGEMVLPFISSANRDPRQFRDPARFDIRRDPNRHLSFAFGIHFCLGAPLARLEAQLAFRSILDRFAEITRTEDAPRWKSLIFFRALERLPLQLTPRAIRT